MHHTHIVMFFDAMRFVERQAVSGVMRYANAFGRWHVTLAETHENPSVPEDCSGVIACTPTAKTFAAIRNLGVPLALINLSRWTDTKGSEIFALPHVKVDSRDFGHRAADFFLSRAPRAFVYVGTDLPQIWDEERKAAFVERIRAAGRIPHVYAPPPASASSAQRAQCLRDWIAALPRPMSIFASNDERAHEVLAACRQADVTVPYEAEILGVDNDEWVCELARPRLSSIPFRSEECGFEAAQILDALIRKSEDAEYALPPLVRTVAAGEIVERESTCDRRVGDPIVSRALAFIQLNRGLNIRAQDIANALGYTTNWIEKHFRETLGTSVIDEISRSRISTVLHLIRNTSLPFLEIAHRCGFTNASTLCRLVKKKTGKTMTELRWDG